MVAHLVLAQAGQAEVLFEVEVVRLARAVSGQFAQQCAPYEAVAQVALQHHDVERAAGQHAAVRVAFDGVADAQEDALEVKLVEVVHVEQDLAMLELERVLVRAAATACLEPNLLVGAQFVHRIERDGFEGGIMAVQLEELVRLAALLRQTGALVGGDGFGEVEVVREVAIRREGEHAGQRGIEALLLVARQADEAQLVFRSLRFAHELPHVAGDVLRAERRVVRHGARDAVALPHEQHAVLKADLRPVLLLERVEVGEAERGIVAAERQQDVVDGGFVFEVQRSEFHGALVRSIGCVFERRVRDSRRG